MKTCKQTCLALLSSAALFAPAAEPVELAVRQTPAGPRIFVDGRAVRPRFVYVSPPCLSPISMVEKHELVVPFVADADTAEGRVSVDGFDGDEPLWFSRPFLVDETAHTTNSLARAEGGEERTRHFVRDGLGLRKGHGYRFHVTHHAARFRTYFRHEVSYARADGARAVLPLPYADALSSTVRLAADAGVDFVTFSPDTSWGWEEWWAPTEGETDYSRIDALCERIVAANPRALLVPRVSANAPKWMLERDPSLRMKFDRGFTIEMSSVSARSYRKAACEAVEGLARHLQDRFPRNFAGLHVAGQNSAEWFYMMSQSSDLSGYDVHTRDAFRRWLAERGEEGAATAEVPAAKERRAARPGGRLDPERDRRLVQFGLFRQEEMADFLCELGAAIKRGSGGKALSLFFYGYTWELGGVWAGAPETGHFAVERMLKRARGAVDGFSAPISYSDRVRRGSPGSTLVMSAAETIMRSGYLWINEDDTRTHLEDLWTFPIEVGGQCHSSPEVTRNTLLRNAAFGIMRGYGDWWMDLCGRGWFDDAAMWSVRKALDEMDDEMLARKGAYSPDVAVVVDEESFMLDGCGSSKRTGPFLDRRGFALCGATTGQYLLGDVLANPPEAKLFFVAYAPGMAAERRARLDALRASRPASLFFEAKSAGDLSAQSVAALARRAGAHLYTEPGAASVCAAEGYVVVQSRAEGPIKVDFGPVESAVDVVSQERFLSTGPVSIPFRAGETRVFRQLRR